MEPLVSVIIPTFNRAQLVYKAVESVIQQTYKPIEIIVVDDGSTDNTEIFLKLFEKQIRYLKLNHSGLPAKARNAGIRIAQGEYIAFIDSDDLWLPDKIARQLEVLIQHPGISLVCTNGDRFNDHSTEGNYITSFPHSTVIPFSELLKNDPIITSSVILRKQILERVGLFCEATTLRSIEDYDLWLRIAAISKAYFLDESLVLYRYQFEQSITGERVISDYYKGMIKIVDRTEQFLREKQNMNKEIFARILYRKFKYKLMCEKALLMEGRLIELLLFVLGLEKKTSSTGKSGNNND